MRQLRVQHPLHKMAESTEGTLHSCKKSIPKRVRPEVEWFQAETFRWGTGQSGAFTRPRCGETQLRLPQILNQNTALPPAQPPAHTADCP